MALPRFGFQIRLETIVQILAVIVTMVSCTAFINHSLRASTQATRQVMVETYTAIIKENRQQDESRDNLQDKLDLIKKGQELELDRLSVQADMIKALQRKYGKSPGGL